MKKLRLISIFLATCIVLVTTASAFSVQVNCTNNSTTVSAWSSDVSQGSEFTTSFNTTNSQKEYLALEDGTITQNFEAMELATVQGEIRAILNSSDLVILTALNKQISTNSEGVTITAETDPMHFNGIQAATLSSNTTLKNQEVYFSWNDGMMIIMIENKSVVMVPGAAISRYLAATSSMVNGMVMDVAAVKGSAAIINGMVMGVAMVTCTDEQIATLSSLNNMVIEGTTVAGTDIDVAATTLNSNCVTVEYFTSELVS